MSFPSSSSRGPSRMFQFYSGAASILTALAHASGDIYCSKVQVSESNLATTRNSFPINLTTYIAPIDGKNVKLESPLNGESHAFISGLAGKMVFERFDPGESVSKKFIVVDSVVRAPSNLIMRPTSDSADDQAKLMLYPAQIDFACLEAKSHTKTVFSILISVDDENEACSSNLAPGGENLVIKTLLDSEYNPNPLPLGNRSDANGHRVETFYPALASSDFIIKHVGSFINETCSADAVNNFYLGGIVISGSEMYAEHFYVNYLFRHNYKHVT